LNEGVITLIAGGLALASLMVWVVILARRAAGQPILPAEPRRDVPWRWVDVALVVGPLVGFSVIALIIGQSDVKSNPREVQPQEVDIAEQFVPLLLKDGVVKLALIGFAVALGVVRWRASAADFGIANRAVGRDIKLGALGFVAALLPVYCVQAFMLQISPPDQQHPVLQMLAEKSDVAALVLAVFVAVVLAPLVEEFLFRAFLQGWLETSPWKSLSRKRIHRPKSLDPSTNPPSIIENPIEWNSVQPEIAETSPENPYPPPMVIERQFEDCDVPTNDELMTPGRPAIAAILISSVIFAMLHANNWPSPVPLFFLALILGYLYNRTHRLLPCIVVHALFNGLSVAAVLSGVDPK
jgi:membrane protease YdiL (CAAX protease family)